MDIKQVLLSNYLPYAKGVIIGRAIPSIDGLKPSQRRILYTMYKMGLVNGGKTKSSNIVGQSMKLHPHGDGAIYETIVRMASGHEALNIPYIESKGNFGKHYSKDLAYAASRYTEAKLTPISKEIFDGIDENAVDMIENFDNTMMEPTLLPVKFPSILVNPSNGIAVGLSSSIPSFSLLNTCKATIGMLNGTITDIPSLMDVLGVPEYTTGGYIHASRDDLIKLGQTGQGTFTMSGTVQTYPDRIVISEIPYKTTAEDIVAAIEEHVKNGNLKEVTEVSDEIDLKGFRLVVLLRRSANSKAVLQKLCRLTPLRTTISYNTRVIINDRCEQVGLYDLLRYWIEFRCQSIQRIYQHRLNKASEREHLLSSWEKIDMDVRKAALIIASNEEDEALAKLMKEFSLDEVQANYILDVKARLLTKTYVRKKLAELNETRNEIANCNIILGSDNEKYKIMIKDLQRIIDNYSSTNKTQQADPIVEVAEPKEEEKIDDSVVNVIMTKSGYLKRLASLRDITSYELPDGEEEAIRWLARNNEHLLVFTYDGTVYKILVNSIDAGRGGLKDEVYKLIGLPNPEQIMFIDMAGDYSKYFNLVYPNGRGTRVYYNKAKGNRKKYKSLFDPCQVGKAWITTADKFFMITARRKAAYCSLELMGMFGNRSAFKVARVNSGDAIIALQPIENVPDMSAIDLDRYKKEYTVSINEDVLWYQESNDEVDESAEVEDASSTNE